MKSPQMVIKSLEVTEKSTRLTGAEDKYFFTVNSSANKVEIKQAIEQLFKVGVVKINTMNYLGKKKRERTAHYGKKSDWKRAVVTLKKGDKIDLE